MKSKNSRKKLELNKKTISNLDKHELRRLEAGMRWTDPRICCETIVVELCSYSCP
jgi:hypothetical protein